MLERDILRQITDYLTAERIFWLRMNSGRYACMAAIAPELQKEDIVGGLHVGRMVTALEIMQVYAGAYAQASFTLALAIQKFERDAKGAFNSGAALGILQGQLEGLLEQCGQLPVTAIKIKQILTWLNNPQLTKDIISGSAMASSLMEVHSRLVDELSTRLYFEIPHEHKLAFEEPLAHWGHVLGKAPECVRDIEEMNRCFALSRYTAAIFHALQIAEWGAIHLGILIGVSDPKRGWGATTKLLEEIIKNGRTKADASLLSKFPFLEQMHREINTMVFAWRHKVDHADGRLYILPNTDFTPDVAEHIMQSVKVFMSRLCEEI